MNDDQFQTTRRGLLALAGSTALAGCNALPNPFDSSPPRLDGTRLAEITSGGVPSIPQTVPVTITDDHIQRHVDRTQSLLSQAPLPFEEQEIPNGAMRQEINATAEEARTIVDQAQSAGSPFEAILMLRNGQGKARTVATAWAYADEGLRRDDLTGEAGELASGVATFREGWSYVGDDPVRALLVHETLESLVSVAFNNAEGQPDNPRVTWSPENLVTVSRYAADLERGQAALADARYMYDRLRTDLETSNDLRSVFESALDQLLTTLQTATTDLDESNPVSRVVDADIENSPVRHPLQYLHGDITRLESITSHRDHGEPASAILSAHRDLTRLRGFEDLRRRMENGESFTIESAEDVAKLRETAVTAIETALQETAHPGLSRTVLHNMAGLVTHVDSEIGPYDSDETVSAEWIGREVGDYIYAATVAQVTPAVSETVATTLSG